MSPNGHLFMAYLTHPSIVASLAFVSFLIAVSFIQKKNKKEYSLKAELEDLQGRINIASQQLEVEESRSRALRFKLRRYDALSLFTEKLNQNLSLDDTLAMLLGQTLILLGHEKTICMVYSVDSSSGEVVLEAAKNNTTEYSFVKGKDSDMFNQWVVKHMQPLLVEDTVNDFRFDIKKLKTAAAFPIGSLIACCLVSQNSPRGIVRLDSPYAKSFTLEDLRALNTIADIASVAMDNAHYYQHLKELVVKDSLTAMYTRAFILDKLKEELQHVNSATGGLAVMMIDIDYFKQYNDLYGHVAGDSVLKNLSAWLGGHIKPKNAHLGRYGGEEFLIIVPSCTKQEGVSLAETIRSFVQEKKMMVRRKATAITVSIGVAHCPQDAASLLELLHKADTALYEAKKLGRNRVCLF